MPLKTLPDEQQLLIRDCASLEDFEQCVALQQAVWGFADRDLIPVRFFVVAHKIEGQVIGAFDMSGNAAGRLIGFCLAVPALRGRQVYLHSHMLAVLPQYRGGGLGRRIKLEQRRQALERGIDRIEWTFDPLEAGNAHFNIGRLGAIVRRYVPNQYGISTSPLHRGLPTDRLVAEWWLKLPRVAAAADGQDPISVNVQRRIAIPRVVVDKDGKQEPLLESQAQLREQLQDAFAHKLAIVGFEIAETTGTYLLGLWEEPQPSGEAAQ